METNQEIPDFLEQFKPEEGAELDFEEADEMPVEGTGEEEGGGWGAGGDDDKEAGGWGETNGEANENGGFGNQETEGAAW